MRATGRIASAHRFDGYFTLQRPADDVPRTLTEDAWQVIVGDAPSDDVAARLTIVITELTERQRGTF